MTPPDHAPAPVEESPAGTLPRLRGTASRHGKKLGAVGLIAIVGSVWAVLQGMGFRITTADAGPAAAPGLPSPASGDGDGPPPPTTRERVRQVEERLGKVEDRAVEIRDRLGEVATKQQAVIEAARELKGAVDRRDEANAARFDRIAEKIDGLQDAVRDAASRGRGR